jgi:hypothetical protein
VRGARSVSREQWRQRHRVRCGEFVAPTEHRTTRKNDDSRHQRNSAEGHVWSESSSPAVPDFRASVGVVNTTTVKFMPRGRPSPKLAITVDPDVHEQVLAAAADDGVSVSAWMTAAARRALSIRDGLRAVAEWEREHSAFSESEIDQARRRVTAEVAQAPRSRSA